MNVQLYRGITVKPEDADEVTSRILAHGLNGAEGMWKIQLPADIGSAQTLARQSLDDPSSFDSVWDDSEAPGLCACGSRAGAVYYASKHNIVSADRKTLPLLITIRTSLDRIYVDCRDFLMPAFQRFDHVSSEHTEAQNAVLKMFFGEAVLPYFNKCRETESQQHRIAMGNMAAFDQDVIRSHLVNSTLLGGRYGTKFESAFFVSAPVAPSDIVSVETLGSFSPPTGAYSLDDFFNGKPVQTSGASST